LTSVNAHACSATAQDVFLVGNTASDAACNYSTVQAAINAATCPAGTRIYLTSEVSYTAQHLAISNKNVSLIGRASGTACGALSVACGQMFPCPTAPLETISGSGHSGDSVITIRGASNVTIQYLTVSDGQDSSSGSGGGIDYDGTGTLTLDTSTISNNTAGYGGGINVKSSGGAAALQINKRTLIIGNTASTSGGGIRLEGGATTMTMDAPYTWVALNQATSGYGGGVEILNNAIANIGSPGYVNAAVIYDNTPNTAAALQLPPTPSCTCIPPIRCTRSGLTTTPHSIPEAASTCLRLRQAAPVCAPRISASPTISPRKAPGCMPTWTATAMERRSP